MLLTVIPFCDRTRRSRGASRQTRLHYQATTPQLELVGSGADMTSVVHLDEATRHDLLMRLRRIEGQARGTQRMIEQGRDCEDILCELAALRSATQAASLTLLEQYTVYGLRQASDAPSLEQAVAHLVSVIELYTR